MERIVIVGSGASGVHFALSLLEKNYPVTMLDVGYQGPNMANIQDDFTSLRTNSADPVSYFLGENLEGVLYPDDTSEYYGIPPTRKYVFSKPSQFNFRAKGFAPLFSFAQGGLAEVWTGGVYPLNDNDLSDFPFSYQDIAPYYAQVASRIGISGTRDDLAAFLPFHHHITEPLILDEHSTVLLSAYNKNREHLNKKLNVHMGRSRIATLSHPRDDRHECTYSGRCLWGCPVGALYTPSLTLQKCMTYDNFNYIQDMLVTHFLINSGSRVTHAVATSTKSGQFYEFALDKLILAAGTLSSSKIFMESIFKYSGNVVKLRGLMDNRQVFVPFINLNMMGKNYNPKSYQYHQIALGIEKPNPKEYLHGQITTLKSSLIHPIIQSIPFDIKNSIYLFRNSHAALGVINLNFCDDRRNDNYLSLDATKSSPLIRLLINYRPKAGNAFMYAKAIRTVKKALLRLGCIVPPSMTHIRPMGSSVHYSGTIPMSNNKAQFTTSHYGQSSDFDNLFFVDGTTFPFLPAKNLTFTLMANAARIADKAF